MSSLPFLQPKKQSSVVVVKAHSDGRQEPMGEEGEMDPGLMSAAESLISAVHAKDATAVAEALQAAYEMCASYEGEYGDEDDAFDPSQEA